MNDEVRIYVDELPSEGWGKWNGGGHMLANDIDALHEFAAALGLKREWFQDKRNPHYDLTRSKRALALQRGAIPIELAEFPDDSLLKLDDGTYIQRWENQKRRELGLL